MARHQDLAKVRYWRQHLRRWRSSGLGVRAYCRAEGLSEPSFYAWRRLLTARRQPAETATRRRRTLSATPAFVPVLVSLRNGAIISAVARLGRDHFFAPNALSYG